MKKLCSALISGMILFTGCSQKSNPISVLPLSIFSDNDIRSYDGSIYVIERQGKDNIMRISAPSRFSSKSVFSACISADYSSANLAVYDIVRDEIPLVQESDVAYEKNIGTSVNIQDIVFVNSSKAYVTQLASSKIDIIDPSTGIKSNKAIDLSPYDTYVGTDSAETIPYMTKALIYNGKVYVACQRLKAPSGGYLQAADTSLIVVIDATTDAVESAIKLSCNNPQEMSICNGNLYVASLGKYGILDGGIECIDLSSGTNAGTILDENMLQGDVGSIIVISATKGYAVISTPSFSTEMWAFNPQTKSVGMKISGIESPCTGHFAYDGTYVYAGDRSMTNPGIVVVDPSTDTKVGSTKNVGLPPNSLAYLKID